ncbi:hypothetical protein CDAR_38031 [Caerostris darwini]|uniref:Uncharacterized protein n=1 Tax=Caerostris darwini TaxID=1538125 RepID=A0AAV4WHY6_9ARAC|nr:hypothetical protein CDAR_38031 [Caerostris darwini]
MIPYGNVTKMFKVSTISSVMRCVTYTSSSKKEIQAAAPDCGSSVGTILDTVLELLMHCQPVRKLNVCHLPVREKVHAFLRG